MKMGQNLLEKYIDENKKLPLTLKMDELFLEAGITTH